jgi:hypothetical protein
MDKFLWGKLFLTSRSFYPYFIWNFWSQLGPPSDQISLNYFKLIQKNPKQYCASGQSISFSSRAGPRASVRSRACAPLSPAPLTGWTRLSAAPPPGTVPAHPSDASLPSLSGRHARARRTSPARATLRLMPAPPAGRGQAPRHPCAVWHPTPGPPFLPFAPLCRAAAEPFPPRSLPCSFSRLHSSPTPPLEPHLPRVNSDQAPPLSATP